MGGTSGQGPGLSPYSLGQRGGSDTVTLNETNLPAHNHTLQAARDPADSTTPAGYIAFDTVAGDREYAPDTNSLDVILDSAQVATTGGNQAHNNMQPYLALGFCIALTGMYPSQS